MKVYAFFDGGNRRADQVGAGAAVIYDEQGNEIATRARFLEGDITNNVAEYTGLHVALELAAEVGATDVHIFGDSEVIVRQVTDVYQVHKPHLRPLRARALELARVFERVKIEESPRGKTNRRRDNNARADELCTKCMNEGCDLESKLEIDNTEEVKTANGYP